MSHTTGRDERTLWQKIVDWFKPSKSLDNEINTTMEDIAFLNRKIFTAKNLFCDVIASKLTVQRDMLVKRYERLLAKRRRLFK